ncbi:Uncharacterized protein LI90_2112 [Carbonactinospora thermoautotrophica]|uniref:site-specific DNA-methyltransferase (adenine-specific) n=1 Tax=Carbonactinospora thermoautotrophica TaxID=1469144 RepID=A0A132MTG0_9ACTN|nr:restriction endonuclease [Carbonactinospora thermoautotrophica]KWX01084.1 Uncharacterized protein LI90_2112 [Carbonactinospora thermoautotrophica]
MTYDSLVNRGDYFSAHYLAEVLPRDLKKGLAVRWAEEEKQGRVTPRAGLRALRRTFFSDRAFLAEQAERYNAGDADDSGNGQDVAWRKTLHELHDAILRALGYDPRPQTLTVQRAGKEYEVPVAHAEPGLVAVECGWAVEVDAALDRDDAGRLLQPVPLNSQERVITGSDLASFLFAAENPPRYVLILAGGVLVLADRAVWGEGRYLGVSLDAALGRNDTRPGGELELIAALFGADSLRQPAEGGAEPLAELVANSHQHAVGVSDELREGLQRSVELIANEVLQRIRDAGLRPEQIMEPAELAEKLTRESLRYLYRILFLLYAEARPELGILPVDYPEYVEGYGLARLGNLVVRDLVGEQARNGFHLYESLDLLFRLVNEGYRPRGMGEAATREATSEGEGIRFEPLKSDLFDPGAITLIGRTVENPLYDEDESSGQPRYLDTRLRNATLHRVLRLLMLARGRKGERGGFISYAQLGINQIGAVYEGLMSYTGFIADEELYEVAKDGDPSGGSWLIPASKVPDYPDEVFVYRENPETGERERVCYPPGSFVYRLSGRARQTSASYYTPESLTRATVELALKHRLRQDTKARELLEWRICEPALGSGAFLNEAINQVAAEYLKRRQEELGQTLPPEEYATELQKVKAYIALHNCYGVDLNATAVELAEISIWLNVMHPGLQAPWFGLHLRRGNSLIGAGRRYYDQASISGRTWLTTAPTDHPFTVGALPDGAVHHFLLPAYGWGAVAAEKEAKELAPEETERLAAWRRGMRRKPTKSQLRRLQALARRAEYLWALVIRRLKISEREISRRIDVWGAKDLPKPVEAVPREKVQKDLREAGTPYWRLKTVMDTWCALWFWPVDQVGLLDGSAEDYRWLRSSAPPDADASTVPSAGPLDGAAADEPVSMGATWDSPELPGFELPKQMQMELPSSGGAGKPKATGKQTAARRRTVTESVRPVVPLANLDDWLDFAEAVLGREDIGKDNLATEFETLADLDAHERDLPIWMGMDFPHQLADRFPWLKIVEEIAKEQGFFHWELEFAHVFADGGFDLQMGNPPWVKLEWDEAAVLAELEPWFKLVEKASVERWRDQKRVVLASKRGRAFFLNELASQAGAATFYGSSATYDLLVGTQPDLYRAFMIKVWANLKRQGIAGLIHPDTHFSGNNERRLRAEAYARLRLHADFMNAGNRFFPPPVSRTLHFGLHIYGSTGEINFTHLSWLFDISTLMNSFVHDGTGELPGVKYRGDWDTRPHRARVINVDRGILAEWRLLSGETDLSIEEAKLLYPVTSAEQEAILTLGKIGQRLGRLDLRISRGYDEKGAKDSGLIRWQIADTTDTTVDWSEVVLQGPHLGVATPFFKQPPNMGSSDRPQDLTSLPEDAVPRTNYRRATDVVTYQRAQDRWVDHRRLAELLESPEVVAEARQTLAAAHRVTPDEVKTELVEEYLRKRASRRYTEFYRLAWREMIPSNTDRSLFAALVPPGPAHIHAVRTIALSTNRETALVAGFWAALPIDYLLRITGQGHLDVSAVRSMPAPDPDHPLAAPLLLRTLRLNCLTNAYADLWAELYEDAWRAEQWAADWPGLSPLGAVGPTWEWATPLRTERERRAALVELDALVAVWLGITAEQLVAIYRSRYPVLSDYEAETWFDANGRKIAANFNAYGHGQTKEHYERLMDHLEDPERVSPPDGYTPPFYKADRETEMRQAHAVFSARLRAAREGEQPA